MLQTESCAMSYIYKSPLLAPKRRPHSHGASSHVLDGDVKASSSSETTIAMGSNEPADHIGGAGLRIPPLAAETRKR